MQPLNLAANLAALDDEPLDVGFGTLAKLAREATGVLRFFAIAARRRIGEKSALLRPKSVSGARHDDVRYVASGHSRRCRGCHGIPSGVVDRPPSADDTIFRSRRG